MSALSIAMVLIGGLVVITGFSTGNKFLMGGGLVCMILGILVSEPEVEE